MLEVRIKISRIYKMFIIIITISIVITSWSLMSLEGCQVTTCSKSRDHKAHLTGKVFLQSLFHSFASALLPLFPVSSPCSYWWLMVCFGQGLKYSTTRSNHILFYEVLAQPSWTHSCRLLRSWMWRKSRCPQVVVTYCVALVSLNRSDLRQPWHT